MSQEEVMMDNSISLGKKDYYVPLSEIGVDPEVARLFNNTDMSDVTLVVGEDRTCEIPAHRCLLGAKNDYLKALLHGQMKEARERRVRIREPRINEFKILLKTIYTNRLEAPDFTLRDLFLVLSVATKYLFTRVEEKICECIASEMNADNLMMILRLCREFNRLKLMKTGVDFAAKEVKESRLPLRNVIDIFNLVSQMCFFDHKKVMEKFLEEVSDYVILDLDIAKDMPLNLLMMVLARKNIRAKEIDVFRMMRLWLDANDLESDSTSKGVAPSIKRKLISLIDFRLIDWNLLVTEVKSSCLLSSDELLEKMQEKTNLFANQGAKLLQTTENSGTFTWTLENVSQLATGQIALSPPACIGDYIWNLRASLNDWKDSNQPESAPTIKVMSVYLSLYGSLTSRNCSVTINADVSMRSKYKKVHKLTIAMKEFAGAKKRRGWPRFATMEYIQTPEHGFYENDRITFEVKVTHLLDH